MIVCHCHGLTDRDIRTAAARTAARCAEDLPAECQAATCCGGCRPLVDEILRGRAAQAGDRHRTASARRRRSA